MMLSFCAKACWAVLFILMVLFCTGYAFNHFYKHLIQLYSILIRLMGLEAVTGESEELAGIMLIVLLVLGNVTFTALDRLLTILAWRLRRKRRPPCRKSWTLWERPCPSLCWVSAYLSLPLIW